MTTADKIALVLAYALAAVLWAWMWWHIISKIGYRGVARKLWLVGMCIPPFLSLTMVLLLVLPWPIYRQLRQLRKQVGEDSVEAELKRLKANKYQA